MIEAPVLTLPEVRQEVERIFRRDHRSRLVALFGRGEAIDFEVGGQPWRVVPTRCELDLRERFPRPDAGGDGGVVPNPGVGNVYLIDWTIDVLPLDIACRLAGGRLYHVARDARLAALFGARQVEPGLPGSALAKIFLAGGVPQPRKVQGIRLTRAEAWASLLEAKLQLPEPALGSVGALLGWAARHEGGGAFVRQTEADDLWRNVRRELHEWIRGTVGDAGLVVFQAWERGLAGRLLEVVPLLSAARDAGDAFLAGQLAGQLSSWLPDLAAAVRAAEAEFTADRTLELALPPDRSSLPTLEGSQALAEGAGLGGLTAHSPRLPGGHKARERALAAATRAFVERPGADAAAAVVGALTTLEAHGLDAHLRPETHREARRNLGRLALWHAWRPVAGPPGTRWQPAVDLARGYAEEGGHVEWARQQLRGLRGADEALLGAARALEEAVAGAMRHDHRSFAEAYVSWVEAGKPSSAAVPIEDLGKQVIAPFLQGGARRKLLVILMDGMSHAAATQVLTRLGTARRWGPIAWRKEGWHGVLPLPPVLAVAPTLTEVSRGAFFAGKADPRFGEEATDKDPARWRAHKAVADLLGADPPPLFMRKEILSGHDLAPDIREAIEGECRAVAVVVNAVDEDLKSSVQVAKDYSLAPVLPLEALLSAAEEGERAVLLVADHGHVLGDSTRTLTGRMGGGRPGGPRWRALAKAELPRDEEVTLPASAWTPAGWHRVAVLWDPAVVNRSAKYGEHGGLSLAEAVSPALLIAPDWLERAIRDDPGLAVRPFPTPEWWDLRVRKTPIRREPSAPQPDAQAPLFSLPSTPSARPAARPALVEALRRSSVFQAQVAAQPASEVDRVLACVAALAEAGGALPSADFAAAAGVRPHQVAGAVARMGVLNADGFAMVEHDHVGRQVVLHRARLTQHYGVKE